MISYVKRNLHMKYDAFSLSLQPFFVERAFRIFDRDGNGTVSMAEFIDTMHQFAGQSPDEKLVFLFKVYDLDGKCIVRQWSPRPGQLVTDHYSHLKFVCFARFWRTDGGKTCVKIVITTGHVDQKNWHTENAKNTYALGVEKIEQLNGQRNSISALLNGLQLPWLAIFWCGISHAEPERLIRLCIRVRRPLVYVWTRGLY